MTTSLEILRKRLLWRATHRGIKEMDIVVGGFAQLCLPEMTEQQLGEFEVVLDIPDQDLFSWITGQEPVPADKRSDMLSRVLQHRPALTT